MGRSAGRAPRSDCVLRSLDDRPRWQAGSNRLESSLDYAIGGEALLNRPFTIIVHGVSAVTARVSKLHGASKSISRQGSESPTLWSALGTRWWFDSTQPCASSGRGLQNMEDHAREAEARAKSLSKKLEISEERVEAAERAWREIIHQSDCKLQEASKALERAQSRIAATEIS